ncbi:unnamed protein product [Rotaria sordida]|uniref:DDE Tnp4 domain-containing protein n=2 Tax=Rotaria sordida TaxID=392033 RepID=A0A819FCA1_9BILA|nr:unnamed protein product [Rotaria sordida]
MIPQCVRVVFPSNKNIQVLLPSQQSVFQCPRPSTLEQIRIVNPTAFVSQSTSNSSTSQSHVIPSSLPASLISKEQATQNTSLFVTGTSSCEMPSLLSQTTSDVAPQENTLGTNSTSDTDVSSGKTAPSSSTSMKRQHSSSYSMNKGKVNKSLVISENDDRCKKKIKRAKNLSEEETSIFISVWSEYYDSLISSGSRNMPIYNSMAQHLNQLLSPRVMSGGEVKAKIFNLVAEYRERPYNDDNLMSDTMLIQEDEFIEEIENAPINNVNVHELLDEGDPTSSFIKAIEERTKDNRSGDSNSPSNSSCTQKSASQHATDSSIKKVSSSKKKKISDLRVDLMQQILTKIDGANELANQAESKALLLLEKQMKLQEEKYEHQKRKQRRALLCRNMFIYYLHFLIDQSINIYPRTIWSYSKSGYWWSNIVPMMNDKQFKNNFRIQRSTFKEILHQVGPYLKKKDTVLRPAIPVDKRLACALYLLGSTCELRTVAHLFGIGKSTAAQLLHDFCEVFVNLFFHRLIKFPVNDQQVKQTTDAFLNKYGYPMCIGSIDGTHISIEPPIGEETDYFNYKKFHSIILLGVVDASLKFSYVNIGAPGRCNDAFVYNRSTLFEVMQNPVYAQNCLTVNNVKIQAHLIADSAFPLSNNLMKPYTERTNMPQHQSLFNYRLSRCRCTIERSFGHLKNRFRSIHKKMEYDIEHVKNIIKAACILHNICVDSQDAVETDWDIIATPYKKPNCYIQTLGAVDMRDALSFYFLQNPL